QQSTKYGPRVGSTYLSPAHTHSCMSDSHPCHQSRTCACQPLLHKIAPTAQAPSLRCSYDTTSNHLQQKHMSKKLGTGDFKTRAVHNEGASGHTSEQCLRVTYPDSTCASHSDISRLVSHHIRTQTIPRQQHRHQRDHLATHHWPSIAAID